MCVWYHIKCYTCMVFIQFSNNPVTFYDSHSIHRKVEGENGNGELTEITEDSDWEEVEDAIQQFEDQYQGECDCDHDCDCEEEEECEGCCCHHHE